MPPGFIHIHVINLILRESTIFNSRSVIVGRREDGGGEPDLNFGIFKMVFSPPLHNKVQCLQSTVKGRNISIASPNEI